MDSAKSNLESSLGLTNGEPDTKGSSGEQASATQTAPEVGPALPPSNKESLDALLADLNRTPLFMTSLDNTDGEGGSNVALDALRELAHEGTPAEVAENFRGQGNECARAKRWADAKAFYTQALDSLDPRLRAKAAADARSSSQNPTLVEKLNGNVGEREVDWLDRRMETLEMEDHGDHQVVDLEAEAQKERAIEEACAVNRALCNLELKNYGQVTRDAAQALRLNPHNTKAYYRSATALLALDKTTLALQTLDTGLSNLLRGGNPSPLKALRPRIEEREKQLQRITKERNAREERDRRRKVALQVALKQRGLSSALGSRGNGPDMEDAQIALTDPDDPKSELQFPLLVLYPCANQSELLKAVVESSTVGDVLATVLPAPWDGGSELGGADGRAVECFVDTTSGGLRKLGKRIEWKEAMKEGGVDLKDGLARCYVVPKGKVTGWVEEMRKRKKG